MHEIPEGKTANISGAIVVLEVREKFSLKRFLNCIVTATPR